MTSLLIILLLFIGCATIEKLPKLTDITMLDIEGNRKTREQEVIME